MVFLPYPMRLAAVATLLSLELLYQAFLARCDVGTAASYGPPYTPTSCNGYGQDQFPPNNMFAAVSGGLWDNGAACGRTYRLRCLSGIDRPCKGGNIVVVVVDKCASNPCPANLLLSREAFGAVSRFTDGKINVEYTQI
ncbi:EG45-like domain containing protein [Phoenix dactylifera]|uniref:EG45-like domain containing protein n=1 Tax=Phoenix dactylifera TaxID=42345 RepID=A0A8B7C5E5_PHODC|nr:EG45-like domain containing protein [Phoenix dactylifera]